MSVENIDVQTLERMNKGIRDYLRAAIVANLEKMYPTIHLVRITPLAESFMSLICDPLSIEEHKEYASVEFLEFSQILQNFHDDMDLITEDEIDDNVMAFNALYKEMKAITREFCVAQGWLQVANEFGVAPEFEEHEISGMMMGMIHPDDQKEI